MKTNKSYLIISYNNISCRTFQSFKRYLQPMNAFTKKLKNSYIRKLLTKIANDNFNVSFTADVVQRIRTQCLFIFYKTFTFELYHLVTHFTKHYNLEIILFINDNISVDGSLMQFINTTNDISSLMKLFVNKLKQPLFSLTTSFRIPFNNVYKLLQ